jgi:pimeloyl-ACP methyl ester carboxylesterase
MIERSIQCLGPHGFHRIVYSEWPGPAGAPVLLCVHGLTRNGKDFDMIAEALSARYRVIAPDMAGRGRSDYLAIAADYDAKLYLSDLAALIARLDVECIDLLGTSMGGTLGVLMAALPRNPIRRLVINDVGPILPKAAAERIVSYVGVEVSFPSIEAMEAALRQIYSVFGPMTDAQMRKLTEDSAARRPDGSFGFAYDPHIADAFKTTPVAEVNLWPFWDAVTCPILLLRGAVSDVLPREVADEVIRRKANAALVEFAGIGHAPPLLAEDQIATVRDFLTAK